MGDIAVLFLMPLLLLFTGRDIAVVVALAFMLCFLFLKKDIVMRILCLLLALAWSYAGYKYGNSFDMSQAGSEFALRGLLLALSVVIGILVVNAPRVGDKSTFRSMNRGDEDFARELLSQGVSEDDLSARLQKRGLSIQDANWLLRVIKRNS